MVSQKKHCGSVEKISRAERAVCIDDQEVRNHVEHLLQFRKHTRKNSSTTIQSRSSSVMYPCQIWGFRTEITQLTSLSSKQTVRLPSVSVSEEIMLPDHYK